MDYFEILNLQREPFSNSPEPELFFLSGQHWPCLQKLELAVRLRRGLNVVMGEVGTGKTTLCRQLILNFSSTEEDRKLIETHLILDPSFSSSKEFLSVAALLFGIAGDAEEKTEWQQKEDIKNYLFTRGVHEGKTVALIIDEGQKLPVYCLEILREFLNYETNEHKLLQIIIFAQKEFAYSLQQCPNLADRVNQYYLLKPLNFRNCIKLIRHRLAKASANPAVVPPLFTRPGLWAIYRGTDGYPRKIINVCHQAMLAMIIQNRRRAGYFLVRSCAGRAAVPEELPRMRWAFGLLCAVLIAAGFFLSAGIYENHYSQLEKISVELTPQKTARTVLPVVAEPKVQPHVKRDNQEAASMLAKIFPSAPLPVKPALLGSLTVIDNDCIIRIMGRIYDNYSFHLLDAVRKANPQIRNIDFVKKGDVLNMPVCASVSGHLPQGSCWVQVGLTGNLDEAYRFLTKNRGKIALILLHCWDKRKGMTFPVILKKGFPDEAAAAWAIKSLPAAFSSQARVINKWDEDTEFL